MTERHIRTIPVSHELVEDRHKDLHEHVFMWVEAERQLLQELKRTCLIHMYLQSGSAYLYYIMHHCITIPNIAIGATLSVSLFSVTKTWWNIVSGVLAIISTILSSVDRQIGAGERAQLHCSMVRQYQSAIHNINQALLDPSEDKYNIMSHVKSEVDRLLSTQPDPSIFVIRHFEKKYHRHVEVALYPEYKDLEETIMDNVNVVTKRVSKYRPSGNTNLRRSIEEFAPPKSIALASL